ncbi:MAG TPA: divalent-cation tolerance protein CutA [Caulobacteraceae bacterium]|jgi:periplasmic divalent cation tolerance protein
MDEFLILYTTWPDAETAEACGRAAVEEKLAACANLLAPMRSIYRWQGEVQVEAETPMLLKTTAAAADRLKALILTYSPYDVPCILALPLDFENCNPHYLAWAKAEIC